MAINPLQVVISIGNFDSSISITKREKGKSLLSFPDSFVVLDLETTGLNPQWDSIIEIGLIKIEKGQEINRFESLVNPGFNIDPFITELTGITNKMLKKAPEFEDIEEKILDFIGQNIIVGHNVNFDINFLYDTLFEHKRIKLQNNFVDTMRLSRRLLPELEHHRLQDLASYYHLTDNFHRAIGDCNVTLAILSKLKQIAIDKGYNPTEGLPITYSKGIIFSEIKGDKTKFIEDHIFFKKNICFTGKLEKFNRKDAAQLVADIGGIPVQSVTKHTDFLIVGDFDYNASLKGEPSSKLKKAQTLMAKGQDIKILSETTFYSLLAENN